MTLRVKEPKTKAFVSLIKGHTDAKKVLLISDSFDENTYRVGAQCETGACSTTATDVNTEQLLAFDKIIVTDNGARATGGKDVASNTADSMNEPYDLIQTVQLTEKASLLSEKQNKYVFRVTPRANKIQIKQAIELLFKKKVVGVNTCNYAGKKKRERRATSAARRIGRKPSSP